MPELTVADEVSRQAIAALPMSYPVMSGARAQIISLDGRKLMVSETTCVEHFRQSMRFFSSDALTYWHS